MQTIIALDDFDHPHTLEEIGINKQLMLDIGRRILAGAAQTTPHDAVNASGSFAYFAGVRGLRDVLCMIGWKINRRGNLELTSHPDKDIHFLVSSGNKYTGNPNFQPSTKNQKGTQTRRVVYQNARNPYLFPEMNHIIELKPDESQTWFVLYHFDKEKSEMRMEVSLPISFDENELKVSGWIKRIILESIKFDNSPYIPEAEYAEIPEYDILRKSNE